MYVSGFPCCGTPGNGKPSSDPGLGLAAAGEAFTVEFYKPPVLEFVNDGNESLASTVTWYLTNGYLPFISLKQAGKIAGVPLGTISSWSSQGMFNVFKSKPGRSVRRLHWKGSSSSSPRRDRRMADERECVGDRVTIGDRLADLCPCGAHPVQLRRLAQFRRVHSRPRTRRPPGPRQRSRRCNSLTESRLKRVRPHPGSSLW